MAQASLVLPKLKLSSRLGSPRSWSYTYCHCAQIHTNISESFREVGTSNISSNSFCFPAAV